MKEVKIQFVDIPESAFDKKNNWIVNTLKERYKVTICDEPEFLFYSVFGHAYMNYSNCVKIFFTGEISVPNFNECDFAFSFNYLTFGDRHFRGVLGDGIADTISNIKSSIQDTSNVADSMARRKFCNFVYSQDTVGEGAILRKKFCEQLTKYKRVDCPGIVLNNMPVGTIVPRWKTEQYSVGDVNQGWNKGKVEFLQDYKFTIAFENVRSDGYTTEKLIHPFLARSIPIYWGNPSVARDFNAKAFINCNDYKNFDEVIDRIIELDNDETQYMEMLRQPPMADSYDFGVEEHAKTFLFAIIERGNFPFEKDPLSKDVVNQLREDVSNAWQIIDLLKKEAAEKGIVIEEKKPEETPFVFRVANYLYIKTQSGIGKHIKDMIKPIIIGFMRILGKKV